MARAWHPCNAPDCPTPCPPGVPKCPQHTRETDRARGTKAQRGYGKEYQARRRALVPVVQAGLAACWRCRRPIRPDEAWHLGHDDNDRAIIRGVECITCNLSAAGRKRHGLEPKR